MNVTETLCRLIFVTAIAVTSSAAFSQERVYTIYTSSPQTDNSEFLLKIFAAQTQDEVDGLVAAFGRKAIFMQQKTLLELIAYKKQVLTQTKKSFISDGDTVLGKGQGLELYSEKEASIDALVLNRSKRLSRANFVDLVDTYPVKLSTEAKASLTSKFHAAYYLNQEIKTLQILERAGHASGERGISVEILESKKVDIKSFSEIYAGYYGVREIKKMPGPNISSPVVRQIPGPNDRKDNQVEKEKGK